MVDAAQLSDCDLFAQLPQESVQRLATLMQAHRFVQGDVLVTEGERGDEAFVILEGTVQVSREGIRLCELGPGAVIGEMFLFERVARSATIVAMSDGQIAGLHGRDIVRFRKMDPVGFVLLLINCTREVTHRLRDMNDRYVALMKAMGTAKPADRL